MALQADDFLQQCLVHRRARKVVERPLGDFDDMVGDEWRTFASLAVRQCRKPKSGGYAEVAAKLREIATQEEALWREIKRVAADL